MARMRLRQRPARALGEAWVQPRRAERWTTIGNLDGAERGLVDPAGLVTIAGATWSLDWWVGAEDRWHLPSQEVAVRQSLVSTSPVVETRLRVPSGDAVHRAYAARAAGGAEAIVVEVENQSKIPFALALALRPHTGAGIGRIGRIELDGDSVRVDRRVVLVAARPPGRAALSDFAGGDSAAAVFAGDAAPVARASVRCRDGLAQAALLFPLAHTASLRVAIPLGGSARVEPASLPAATQVAAGWSAHAATGCRIEVPDRRLRDAVAASTKHLLLGAGAPNVADALDSMGLRPRAVDLDELLGSACSTWTWSGGGTGHDLAANAALVLGALARLVEERDQGLALAPVVPDAWLGQGWELHDATTRWGRLSYAVRWHGDRPALLWDLRARPSDAPAVLTAPGLDPTWSTTVASGDALLAPVAVPSRAPRRGLTIPVSIEPVRRPST